MTTWRDLITEEMTAQSENWGHVVSLVIGPGDPDTVAFDLDTDFDTGFGWEQGAPFTLWTQHRVYFPACCDGSEWVESVSRDPDGVPTRHVGGG